MSWEKQLLEGHSGSVGDLVEKFLNSAHEKLLENKDEYEAMAKKAEQLTDELHQCILPSQEDGKKVDKTKIIDNEAEQSELEKLKAAVQKGFDSRGARGSKPEIQKPKTLGALVCVFQFFWGGRGAKHLLEGVRSTCWLGRGAKHLLAGRGGGSTCLQGGGGKHLLAGKGCEALAC